jgi:GTP-binding protein Era
MVDEADRKAAEAGKEAADAGKKAGVVALVGRPNAGKSTLMNRLLEEKVAIVSDKPQTTRHRLVGILSGERGQMVFHDTPGLHRPLHQLNRTMVRYATDALREADLVCVLVDVSEPFGKGDQFLLDLVAPISAPRIAVLNKIDRVAKPKLLPLIQRYGDAGLFAEIVPISALTGDGCDPLLDLLWDRLPVGQPLYDPELLTIHPERFLAMERIREKVLEQTRDELPFTTAVILEHWEELPERNLVRIYASILVDRSGQKGILVGRQGARIKAIGTAARLDLESFLEKRVFLDLKVKLEVGWRENRRVLQDLDRELFLGGI